MTELEYPPQPVAAETLQAGQRPLARIGAKLEVSQGKLLKQVLRFNYAFVGDIHPTCIDVLCIESGAWIERIRNQPRAT